MDAAPNELLVDHAFALGRKIASRMRRSDLVAASDKDRGSDQPLRNFSHPTHSFIPGDLSFRAKSRNLSFPMAQERKTLEQRAQMTDLERLRHSAAHVLATAILRIWPEAQFAAGPPVENGFYYDVELPHRISPEDFAKIEAEMKKEIKANHVFERVVVSRDEALRDGASAARLARLARAPGSRASSSSISSRTFPRAKTISLYRNGDFIDLCAGPHVMRTGNIGAFKLTQRRQRLLQRRRKEPAAPAHLRHRLQEQDRARGILHDARGGEEARPPQDRQGAGAFHLRRRSSAPACRSGCRAAPRIIEELEKLAKETEFAAGYRARADAAPRAREHVSDQRALPVLTRSRCFRRWSLKR